MSEIRQRPIHLEPAVLRMTTELISAVTFLNMAFVELFHLEVTLENNECC